MARILFISLFIASSLFTSYTYASPSDWFRNKTEAQEKKQSKVILVWLVLEDKQEYQLLDNDADIKVSELFPNETKSGVKFLLPGMDLIDLSSISVDDIRTFNIAAIREASKRYGSDVILIGLIKQQGRTWQGNWMLLDAQQRFDWNLKASNRDQMLMSAFDKASATISTDVPQEDTKASANTGVVLAVSNVKSVTMYTNVLAYLQRLPMVTRADVLQVQPNQVIFEITLAGQQQALEKKLAIDQKLVPAAKDTSDIDDVSHLNYQWRP